MTFDASKRQSENLSDYEREIHEGLSAENKRISSKYFYDGKGDELFTRIMKLDEYYLTDCELEIFNEQKLNIFQSLPFKGQEFDLVELGSGDGTKTKILLREFMEHNGRFHYAPIDISENSLDLLHANLQELFPLEVKPFNYTYKEGLEAVYDWSPDRPKLILFMGSNIGNLTPADTGKFLQSINEIKNDKDLFLVGIDLKKDPRVIKLAYDDPAGITGEFNLNVLDRINRELGGNFNRDQFYHFPTYDPKSGAAKSYIVSKIDQKVEIEATGGKYSFYTGEPVFTEISQKYSLVEFKKLAENAGMELVQVFTDSREYFADVLLK